MNVLKKIGSILVDILIVFLVVIILLNVFFISSKDDSRLPPLFGYKFLVDLTDSMLPEISSGDLIIIKEQKDYNVNDIIAYRNRKNELITHRVISVKKENGKEYFNMKGDNNNAKDELLVTNKDIEGKFVKRFANIGTLLLFFKSVYGIIFLLVLVICYITFLIIKEKYFD